MKRFFTNISRIGAKQKSGRLNQAEVILSNKISLILLPIVVTGIILSFSLESPSTSIGLVLFSSFLLTVFPLNKIGKSIISRFGLSIFPQIALMSVILFAGMLEQGNYLLFSYAFIGLGIIPLLLFHNKKEYLFLIASLVINFIIILFFDRQIITNDRIPNDLQYVGEYYFYYKLPQIALWGLLVSAFQFFKRENSLNEERLEATNKSLGEINDEILAQNEVLNDKQIKIEEQAYKLLNNNNELRATKVELLKSIDNLKAASEKLSHKEAEAKSILNALNEHYLIAQYNLNGDLVNINTRAKNLLGVVDNELFRNIKPVINQSRPLESLVKNGHYFEEVWDKIKGGASQTFKVNIQVSNKIKCVATTFAPLFDSKGQPQNILAIGQDVTELIEKNEKIDKINDELKEKISEISQQNILLNFQQKDIFDKSETLKKQKEEIQSINDYLEDRVKERTSVLEAKNKQLAEYAFINSHVLRSPVSTIKGLLNILKYSNLPDKDQKTYDHLKETVKVLDNIVFKINNAIDNDFHFDRIYLKPERKPRIINFQ